MTPLSAALLLAAAVASPAAEGDPGWRGMGPLTAALSSARKEWRPDACLAGMSYGWFPTDLYEPASAKARPDRLEAYHYAFLSESDRAANLIVTFADRSDGISRIDRDQRETALSPRDPQHSRCLTETALDAGQALRAAEARGLTVWDRRQVEVAFVSLPARPEDGNCQYPGGRGLRTETCSRLTSVQKARRSSLTGREFWVVSTKDGAVYLDAAKGRFLFRVLAGE